MSKQKIFGLPDSLKHKAPSAEPKESENVNDAYYFDSYGHFGIHEEMLKDSVRTETYKKAMINNRRNFKDKVVLDVGSGTGILSMFAVEAGAKHVYAIEMAQIAKLSKKIIEKNGFSDKITVIQGKLEEVTLPVTSVDIIISEWMGYFLLFESMLDSVLFARDKWLVKNGLILPDKATLYLCGIEDFEYKNEKINAWEDVYGYNMECIKHEALKEPLVDVVTGDAVITSRFPVLSIDLYTVQKKDLTFEAPFELRVESNNYLHAFVAYFDVNFDSVDQKSVLTTGPFSTETHWKQTVFYTDKDLMLEEGDLVKGTIRVRRNPNNFREIDIFLSSFHVGSEKSTQQQRWYYLR